jgi:predicted ATPase
LHFLAHHSVRSSLLGRGAAGEIALKSHAPDTEKAEEYFDRALAVSRH